MERAQRKASMAKEDILQLYSDNKKALLAVENGQHDFIGWAVSFSYRAETAGGLKTMGNTLFFLNEDLTEVTYSLTEEDMSFIQSRGLEDFALEFHDELREIFEIDNE